MAIPVNPDLPVSYQVPGVYVFLSRQGAAPNATNRRTLFLGYKTSAGTAPAGSPVRVNSEDDVVASAGKGSDLHRMYRAFIAQASGSIGADTWLMPMSPPSGTAQTRLIQFLQSPVGAALGTGNSGAVAAGVVTVWVAGWRADTTVANGDTYATIAANVLAQLKTIEDWCPCTFSVSTDTITLTARHAALTSADLPVMVTFSNVQMAVAASPGTITFATNAAADGSATTGIATQTASSSFLSGALPTAIAAGHITAINAASAFPVGAAQTAASAVVTLFYRDDRVFNWAFTSITTASSTTMTPVWGAEASGLPSSSTPSLATVLTTLGAQEAYKLWITNFTGAGSVITASGQTRVGSTSDYSVLGTLSSFIESMAGGQTQKGQVMVLHDTRSLATAGSVPAGTTPALTASPRYFFGWTPGSPQQAYEMAAKDAAIVVANLDYPPFNYAGQVLLTDSRTPFLLPHSAVRPSDSDCNSAMLTYFLAPHRANSNNQLAIVSGRTTAKPSATVDFRYSFWGTALADDFIRDDLVVSIPGVIAGKTLKNYSPSRTQFTTNADAIRTAVAARMAYYDSLDIFDGADGLLGALDAQVNVVLPSRVDVKLPKRFPIPAEQVSIVAVLAG